MWFSFLVEKKKKKEKKKEIYSLHYRISPTIYMCNTWISYMLQCVSHKIIKKDANWYHTKS